MTTAPLPGCSPLAEPEEEEEVRKLEEQVAESESRLLEVLEQYHGDTSRPKTPQDWAALSSMERAAVQWHATKIRVMSRNEKGRMKRKRRKKKLPKTSSSCSSFALLGQGCSWSRQCRSLLSSHSSSSWTGCVHRHRAEGVMSTGTWPP